MRLLVVDDDAVFREELTELLQQEGHTVSSSSSVVKALEVLESEELDVVLTDLKMPRQTGLDLLREVRRRWPETLVVVITGYATVETAVEAMKEGAFDYVRKPFQIAQIHRVLEDARDELKFQEPHERTPSPDLLIRTWSERDQRDVLRLSPRHLRPRDRVTVAAPDYANPFRIRELVEGFVVGHPHPAVLLEGADELFHAHRAEDIAQFVDGLRQVLDGKGPLVVTFDPDRISAIDARELRASIVAPNVRNILEAISNPIRRSVLKRVVKGPCSFSEAMRAAGLEDSPKLSFHLRKLVDDGLLVHQGETYRVANRGEEAFRLLTELEVTAATGVTGNLAIPFRSPTGASATRSEPVPR